VTDVFNPVHARSASDVWAVGSTGTGVGTSTLAEHWDGSAWKVIPTLSPGGSSAFPSLRGVTATSATDAWAVGFTSLTSGVTTLAEHWNGTAWSVVTSPSPGFFNELFAVDARSATDVWAVGETLANNASSTQPLIEHWNGTSWIQVPGPSLPAGGVLKSVSATSAKNAWAAGLSEDPATGGDRPLIEHWNGTSWTVATSDTAGAGAQLGAVAATSASSAWAVGAATFPTSGAGTFIERWNGSAWKEVASP